MIKTLCVFGTRPETIKMAPVIKALSIQKQINNKVCLTGQHQEMLMPLLELFNINADYNLQVMQDNQELSHLTSRIMVGLSDVIKKEQPDIVLVHGDTTTTFAAALTAFFHKVPVAHVEAGLRTGNIFSPWPEEANRKIAAVVTTMHFAPTNQAKQNLIDEQIPAQNIHVTGNTVVDALFAVCNKLDQNPELCADISAKFSFLKAFAHSSTAANPAAKLRDMVSDQLPLKNNKKIILVTGHRRENFGEGFQNICQALLKIAEQCSEVEIVYPVHLNPNVQEPVNTILGERQNIHLIKPVDYLSFIYLMRQSYLILTDSGGIQEEAPSLGKPVLVMRENSERPEAIEAGTVRLVGTKVNSIFESVQELLKNQSLYQQMSRSPNPYGDGKAASRIVNTIIQQVSLQKKTSQTSQLSEVLL